MTATFTDAYSSDAHTESDTDLIEVTGGNLANKKRTLWSDIQLWCEFENNVNNSSDSGKTVTNGGATFSGTAWRGSYSASFDGTNDYMDLPQIASTVTEFSCAFWMKKTANTAEKRIVAYNNDSTFWQIKANVTSLINRWEWVVYDGSVLGSTVYGPDITTWNHVCLTAKNLGDASFYLNGSHMKTIAIGTMAQVSTTGRKLGSDRSSTANFYDGLIDEFLLWDRQITQAEILEIFNNRTAKNIEELKYSIDGPNAYLTAGFSAAAITKFVSFTETLGGSNAGSWMYQLSTDGATWEYWDGDSWETVSGSTDYNNATVVNTHICDFDTSANALYVKAFAISDGTQICQLSQLDVGYYRYNVTFNVKDSSGNHLTNVQLITGDSNTQSSNGLQNSPFIIPYDTGSVDAHLGKTGYLSQDVNINETADATKNVTLSNPPTLADMYADINFLDVAKYIGHS